MISLTEENYLKALFNLANNAGEVNVNELSKQLAIKMPTVTSMMKKLAEKKLVHYESYKPLRLTEKGKKEAALVVRKHRLTEMYLVDKMGFGWEEVHDIAEQVEHVRSAAFFDKIDELLGFPKLDPHGAPIPDKNGKIAWITYDKLSDCRTGDSVKVSAVIHTSSEFLKFLSNREIGLGTKIKIRSIEPFDRSMVVTYDNRQETLSLAASERLLVEKAK
jgi:DtxR family Mn-dependent transcriptional regulator